MDYKKLEKLIEERNATIYSVAKQSGIPNRVIYDWRKGRCLPKAESLYAISKALGVPMEYFFE